MKKFIFISLLIIGLAIPNIKGMDPLYIKDHGSELLNDKKWHTLKYVSPLNGTWHTGEIEIRQKVNDYDYEFKSLSRQVMFDFYFWYNHDVCCGNSRSTKMEKNKDGGYIGSFTCDDFVPGIDDVCSFLGIDLFK